MSYYSILPKEKRLIGNYITHASTCLSFQQAFYISLWDIKEELFLTGIDLVLTSLLLQQVTDQ